jgi:hypothetical protein
MKNILCALALVPFFVAGVARADNQNWSCSEWQGSHHSSANLSVCPNPNQMIACYVDVTETCTDTSTGQKFTRDYEQFMGCSSNVLCD